MQRKGTSAGVSGEVIIVRKRGVMHLEPAAKQSRVIKVGPASESQKAEVERLRESRRVEAENRALALRNKAGSRRRSA